MKRRVSILLCIALCLMMLPSATRAEAADGLPAFGEVFTSAGTEASPYEIWDLTQLEYLSACVNGGLLPEEPESPYFKLMADIDMSGTYGENVGSWTAIGTESNPFSGVFDGGGHTVTGLYINENSEYLGLFGYVGSGSVKNLSVSGLVLTDQKYTGGIAGYNRGGTITNCSYTGDVSGSGSYSEGLGGIVGFNDEGTVANCSNSSGVSGTSDQGGIVGINSGTVTGCCNTGDVNSGGQAGGIVGNNVGGTVTNCYNTGDVSGDINCGGIVGDNLGGTVINCYSTGSVSGLISIGNVVGTTNYGTFANLYYLDATAAGNGGIASGDGEEFWPDDGEMQKTIGQFASGEVAWLLQNGQEDETVQVWGQALNSDAYPVLTGVTGKKVLQVTIVENEDSQTAKYLNYGGTVDDLPEQLPDPPEDKPPYEAWCANGMKFTNATVVEEDLTVRPGRRVPIFVSGEASELEIRTTYGQEATLDDLGRYIVYDDGWPTGDNLIFEIDETSWGGGELNRGDVLLEGSTLTVPATLGTRERVRLVIEVSEREPRFSPDYEEPAFMTPLSMTILVTVLKANRDPLKLIIDYEAETLSTTEDTEYSLTGREDSWAACVSNMPLSMLGWDGTNPVTVDFRYAENPNYNSSTVHRLLIDARPAAPDVTLALTKTSAGVTVTGTSGSGDYEFSVNRTNWTDGSFTGLSPGTAYTLYVRTKAAGTFASFSMAWPVTTVNADGSTVLKTGETVGNITNTGGSVTMGTSKVTTVTLPAADAAVDSAGRVAAPGGSTVSVYGGAGIVVGDSGASVAAGGDVILPAGGSAAVGGVTVTLPSGGTLDPDDEGDVAVPGGAVVNGVSIPTEGCIIIHG